MAVLRRAGKGQEHKPGHQGIQAKGSGETVKLCISCIYHGLDVECEGGWGSVVERLLSIVGLCTSFSVPPVSS